MLLSRGNSIFAVGFACLACAATHANANLLTNGSFEMGTLVNDGNETQTFSAGPTAIIGWTAVGRQVSWIEAGNPFGITAEDGSRFLDLTAYNTGAPFGGVTQTIATTIGNQYDLSFFLGSYTSVWGGPPVSILASAGGTSGTFTDSAATTASTWVPFSLLFTATSTSSAITLTGAAGLEYIGLDNVDVELVGSGPSGAPEPGTYALTALGLGALAAIIGRSRKPNAPRP
jgi:hypothetical protein